MFGRAKCEDSASWDVTPQGGSFAIDESSRPLTGVRLVVERGAVTQPAKVSLAWCRRKVAVASGRASGVVIRLTAGELRQFDAPVHLSFAHGARADALVIPYRVDESGALHAAQIGALDRDHGRVTIWTNVPGDYTWVVP